MATINAWGSSNPAQVALGGQGNATLTSNALLYGNGTGAIQPLGYGTASQILVSAGSPNLPVWTNAPAVPMSWSVNTGSTVAMAVNVGYIANASGTQVLTLPAVAAVGSLITVGGINNATGWQIAQNAGQSINFGTVVTTTGATGFLQSSATNDVVHLVCTVANTNWLVLSCIGNITYN